jgi:5'-nucleotidase / UDP-sugar diphosphatase
MTRDRCPRIREKSAFPIKAVLFCSLFMALTATGAFSQEKRFTLLHTSDEHAALSPTPMVDYSRQKPNPAVGGFARLATLVKQARKDDAEAPVMLFSSGDIIGGTPFAWLALEGFSPEIELMHQVGYDGMNIGNHEFDYGPEILAEYLFRAGYPRRNEALSLLSANLILPDDHALTAAGIQAHRLFTLSNGIKVGVFGLLGEKAHAMAPNAKPVSISAPHEVAALQVKALQAAGADVIIALTHAGIAEDRKLAAGVTGIDIILGGHDHTLTPTPEQNAGTIILHSGANLQFLGKLELSWNSDTGRLKLVNEERRTPYLIPLDSGVAEDSVLLAQIDLYTQRLNTLIGRHTDGSFEDVAAGLIRTDFPLRMGPRFSETSAGNFVTDAMRLATETLLGEPVHVAFQANGVIRGDIVPGRAPGAEGLVSFFDLVSVSGLGHGPDGTAGYPLVSFYLTAREIHNVLEISALLSQLRGNSYFIQVSGLRYQFDPGKVMWLRIPFLNIPVPACRSVRQVALYTGTGMQEDEEYAPLKKEDQRLFHVVSDYYLTAHLPMVGNILPRLKLVLKDKAGRPVSPEETIILHNGREFKVWEALARHAVSLKAGDKDVAIMPAIYKDPQGRIVSVKGIPLMIWGYLALFTVLPVPPLLIYLGIKIKRKRRG